MCGNYFISAPRNITENFAYLYGKTKFLINVLLYFLKYALNGPELDNSEYVE